MRPGKTDKRYYILIADEELVELKKYTWAMAEAYGLDMKIEKYKGKKPIGLWTWDLDCLEAVLEDALRDYASSNSPEHQAMKGLMSKIHGLLDEAYPSRHQ